LHTGNNKLVTSENTFVGFSVGASTPIGSISEYKVLKDNKFIFTRARPDKQFPNSHRVVKDVMDDIINPVGLRIPMLKKIKCIDKMIPREENKSCYYTFGGKLQNIVRTGLPAIKDIDKRADVNAAWLLVAYNAATKNKITLQQLRSSISKEEYEKVVSAKLSALLSERIKNWYKDDKQSVGIQFIMENTIPLDDMLSHIHIEESKNLISKFKSECLEHFDKSMGYSTQRYKIEILRKELEDQLEIVTANIMEESFDKFKKDTNIVMRDIKHLIDTNEYGIRVINVDVQDLVHSIGEQESFIVVATFEHKDKPVYEILGKTGVKKGINYIFTEQDDLLRFF
jgi:hypothetical protein